MCLEEERQRIRVTKAESAPGVPVGNTDKSDRKDALKVSTIKEKN